MQVRKTIAISCKKVLLQRCYFAPVYFGALYFVESVRNAKAVIEIPIVVKMIGKGTWRIFIQVIERISKYLAGSNFGA